MSESAAAQAGLTVAESSESLRKSADKAGKCLTFALGSEEYGLEILKVREIIGYP